MDIENLKLYRKRHIPEEMIFLKDDRILCLNDRMLVTRWESLHPHKRFKGGISVFFLDRGWKISKMLDSDGNLAFWYCDIAVNTLDPETNTFLCEDLLFDIIVDPDGSFRVLDCDEAADAFSQGLITSEQLTFALHALQELLDAVRYSFSDITALFDDFC